MKKNMIVESNILTIEPKKKVVIDKVTRQIRAHSTFILEQRNDCTIWMSDDKLNWCSYIDSDNKRHVFVTEYNYKKYYKRINSFLEKPQVQFKVITIDNVKELLQKIKAADNYYFDVETTSLFLTQAKLLSCAFSVDGELYVFDFRTENETLKKYARHILTKYQHKANGFNTKFDLKIMAHNLNFSIKNKVNGDVLLRYFYTYSHLGYSAVFSLQGISRYLKLPLRYCILADHERLSSNPRLLEINAADVALTAMVDKKLRKKYDVDLSKTFFHVIPFITKVEMTGMKIDVDRLQALKKQVKQIIVENTKQIKVICKNTDFNMKSPKQVAGVLKSLGLRLPRTKTGYATNKKVLSRLKHPLPKLILECRSMHTFINSYINKIKGALSPDNILYSNFNLHIARTGRLSSSKPVNLQNIVKSKHLNLRSCFISRFKDGKFVAMDYRQLEMRIAAALSRDKVMLQCITSGKDIYDEFTTYATRGGTSAMGKDRDIAKTTVLGKMYGMGINTLMYTLKINREIAEHYIESFESMFPELNNWIIETGDCAVTDGYTTVPLINLRRSLDIDTNDYAYICRRAVNTPIQGLASWLVLLIACELDTRLNPECSVICNLVHDEIDVDCMGDTVGMLRPAMRQSINVVLDKYNAGEYPLYLDFKVEAFDSWGGC